jgi:hypothetical protein
MVRANDGGMIAFAEEGRLPNPCRAVGVVEEDFTVRENVGILHARPWDVLGTVERDFAIGQNVRRSELRHTVAAGIGLIVLASGEAAHERGGYEIAEQRAVLHGGDSSPIGS